MREDDFSIRGRTADPEDPLGAVLIEVNELAETLHEQRLGAVEATALLRTVMEQVDVARVRLRSRPSACASSIAPASG